VEHPFGDDEDTTLPPFLSSLCPPALPSVSTWPPTSQALLDVGASVQNTAYGLENSRVEPSYDLTTLFMDDTTSALPHNPIYTSNEIDHGHSTPKPPEDGLDEHSPNHISWPWPIGGRECQTQSTLSPPSAFGCYTSSVPATPLPQPLDASTAYSPPHYNSPVDPSDASAIVFSPLDMSTLGLAPTFLPSSVPSTFSSLPTASMEPLAYSKTSSVRDGKRTRFDPLNLETNRPTPSMLFSANSGSSSGHSLHVEVASPWAEATDTDDMVKWDEELIARYNKLCKQIKRVYQKAKCQIQDCKDDTEWTLHGMENHVEAEHTFPCAIPQATGSAVEKHAFAGSASYKYICLYCPSTSEENTTKKPMKKRSLIRHILSTHSELEKAFCPLCNEVIVRWDSTLRHIKTCLARNRLRELEEQRISAHL
jgi:hypothetical protein